MFAQSSAEVNILPQKGAETIRIVRRGPGGLPPSRRLSRSVEQVGERLEDGDGVAGDEGVGLAGDRRVVVGVDGGDEAGALDAPEEGGRAGGPRDDADGGGRARAGDADLAVGAAQAFMTTGPGDAEGGAHARGGGGDALHAAAAPGAAAGDDEEPRRLEVAGRRRLEALDVRRAAAVAETSSSSELRLGLHDVLGRRLDGAASAQLASRVMHQGRGPSSNVAGEVTA